ncbi:hypothetical protein EJV47_09595 [Hymenobacter gummosus]|uniref:Uncharacterized protein n=1 Tax=Hymenobacter gummosus TaxID=1776032 RepID=A0A431U4K5_9BACT|nr:hypothetical protein [Hymenobacter gummosus]RTQ50860.1 hypothetical protein EJV47_09595 [Hymenobacter gummosus]
MPVFYSRYLHAAPLLLSVFLLLAGALLLTDATRGGFRTTSAPAAGTEQQTLAEPKLHTVTVHQGRVVARNGQPVSPDSTAPVAAAASAPGRGSWLGVSSGPGRLAEGFLGLLSLLLGSFGMRQVYRARFAPDFGQWAAEGQPEAPVFAFEDAQLRLLRPYPFAASRLAGRGWVAAGELTEVGADGRSAVLAGDELIFFPAAEPGALHAFARRNGLPVVARPDVWHLLAAPLAADYDATEAGSLDAQLHAQGLGAAEQRRIRRQLRAWWLLQPWRWPALAGDADDLHYDHAEVLHLTGAGLLERRRWYWYTMAVALRAAA